MAAESNNEGADRCILCFETLAKHTDRNLVAGKSQANKALDDLQFVVHQSSDYICKQCLTAVKKRHSLQEKLRKIDDNLLCTYRSKCTKVGLTVKLKKSRETSAKRLKFAEGDEAVTISESRLEEDVHDKLHDNSLYRSPGCLTQTPTSIVISTPATKKKVFRPECFLSPVITSDSKCDGSKEGRVKKLPSECPVTVSVKWSDRTKVSELKPQLSSLGKMLCRGTTKQIARAAWNCEVLQQYFYAEVAKQINKECIAMCIKENGKETKKGKESCLRKTDQKSIAEFTFDSLIKELEERAPLLFTVMKTAASKGREDEVKWKPSVCMAAAVCLRNRSQNMIAMQLLIALIIRHSGFVAGMARMQALRITPSHTYFYKKLTQFGKDHDKKIIDMVDLEGKRRTSIIQLGKPLNRREDSKIMTSEECTEAKDNVENQKEIRMRTLKSFDQLKASDTIDEDHIPTSRISVFSKYREMMARTDDEALHSVQRSESDSTLEALLSFDVEKHAKLPPDHGRKLTLDNIDIHQKTHDMTEERQNPDAHYCSLMSTENRVSGAHLPNEMQICQLEELENGTFCPNKIEHTKQRNDYINLVGRIITEHIPCLESLKTAAVQHIPHKYSEKMKLETETTLIGILYENENEADGMQKILDELQKFVPSYMTEEGERKFAEQGVVGDQLTVERGVNGIQEVSNGFTSDERHEGLHFEIADFHGGMKFLELIFTYFYKPSASGDKCTLFADRNLINRRNVSTDVSKNVSACKRFFLLELEARVIAATMKQLQIEDIEDWPDVAVVDDKATKVEKRVVLNSLAAKVVDNCVLQAEKVQALLEKIRVAEEEESQADTRRFVCRFPGCPKTFKYDGKRRHDHERTHGIMVREDPGKEHEKQGDDVYNYQTSLLEVGLLLKNFYDAISEGDGNRVVRCWKFMLPYLIADGASSRKYALEAFYLQCQVNCLLTPQGAHRLVWNRFYKLKAGTGGNIPLDLALEHFNRLIKIVIRNLGPHGLNKNALDRYCKALGAVKEVLDGYDGMCDIIRRHGRHVSPSKQQDLRKVVKELVAEKAFECKLGRKYKKFSDIPDSILSGFDLTAFFKWINSHKKKVLLHKCAR